MSIDELLSFEPGAEQAFKQQWLGYTESAGSPQLRSRIARAYQSIEADEVLVHAGAEEAIFIFMNVALEPEDHIIVHFPCYPSLREIAQSVGCEVTLWETNEENSWELDLEFLQRRIQTNTQAIIINCPHNPTGYVMSQDKLEELVAIARSDNILLFSDEVYRFLEREETLPAACDLYEQAVSLGVMSKTYGLAGLRIGWIATRNRDIYQRMAAFKDYTSICNSAPSEFLATVALKHKEAIIQRNRSIIADNLQLLETFFAQYSNVFRWNPPQGGSTAFPRLQTDIGVEEFCHNLVTQTGVLLLPSTCFDYGNQHFRLGLGRKNLPECLEKLAEYLEDGEIP
ncbi:MAG: aminotransferase class I/II-fold pyridoxal phosphate-dependent enzyme [Cyanophyceae cyanobacterium]